MTEQDVELIETLINDRWKLLLPPHRAERPEWKTGWEVERLNSMCMNIGPGDVVYDIGAEEGDISALVQSWIGTSDGGVVLFEPNDRVFSNIRAIWNANDLSHPLSIFHGFAGDENRNVNLAELKTRNWPVAAYGPLISDHGFCVLHERPDISAVRLDTYVAETGIIPTVITMDVEGGEYNVIQGALGTLHKFMPLVFISVHEDFLPQYGHTEEELYEVMMNLGYRSKMLGVDHETHVAFWHPYGRELRL